MACDSSPGGRGIFFPFFGPLIISLRLGYLKAVSTSCWQTVSTSEVITVLMSSVQKNYSVVLKSQLIINNSINAWSIIIKKCTSGLLFG